jgi:carboxyl-terminal processing protease
LDYSLPPQKISAFLSPDAYIKEGIGTWSVLKTEWLKGLREKSVARVEKNDDFKKIEDELKKAKARGKVIRVSEVLKDKSETKTKKEKEKAARYGNKDQKNKEYLKRADVNEATNVLLDLMGVEESQPTGKQASTK